MRYVYPGLLVLIFITAGTIISAASPVEISVYPSSQIIEKGKEFTINISMDPFNNPVTAAQFNLFFNSSFLEIRNVTEGSFFKQKGANTIFSPGIINNSHGTLINVWGLIIIPGANVTTKGTFARITMYAKNLGSSQLNLTSVIVSSPDSSAVQINATNGSVGVSTYDDKPPASIKYLKNMTYARNYIKWIWTDPSDGDFSKVLVYLNGSYKTSVSKGVMYYNARGLKPGNIYTISTRTVDTSGNVNMTWVNHSARTKP